MIEEALAPEMLMKQADRRHPRVVSVGTSHPPKAYSQRELLELFRVTDPKIESIFHNSHIEKRYLGLPDAASGGVMPEETSLQLAQRHREAALSIGAEAIHRALAPLNLSVEDVDYFTCVTSTGFLCPSLTALFIRDLGFRRDVHRFDVVGMGCNAGLNALQPVANYCRWNEAGIGLQLCVEICSAAYVFDMTMRTSVVNCLFGDGAAATVVAARPALARWRAPALLDFESHIIPAASQAMRFDFDGNKYSFFLDKAIPYVIGENVHVPVDALLARNGLKRRNISHWVVHSGGRKVIDSIKCNLDLSDHDLRHTHSVLKEYGNVSSASFLFSLARLLRDEEVSAGDYVLMMTMGPGSTIECCLGRF
jgi:3,5-dihydroxyphenylacetyl-CoA synthase